MSTGTFPLLGSYRHRHRIDQYLDTLLANHTAQSQVVIARWWTARVIISLFLPNQPRLSSFALTGYAKAGHRRSPMTCHML